MGNEERFNDGTLVTAEPETTEVVRLKLVDLIIPVISGGAVAEQDEFADLTVREVFPCNQVQAAVFRS